MAAKWYRKLPLTIRAEKFDCTEKLIDPVFVGDMDKNNQEIFYVDTSNGRVEIRPGDYVVYGLYGERYVANGVTFEQTHVEVS